MRFTSSTVLEPANVQNGGPYAGRDQGLRWTSTAAHAVDNLPPQDSQTGGDATQTLLPAL